MIKIILFLCRFNFIRIFVQELSQEFIKLSKPETKTLAQKCQEELSALKGKKAIIYYLPKD